MIAVVVVVVVVVFLSNNPILDRDLPLSLRVLNNLYVCYTSPFFSVFTPKTPKAKRIRNELQPTPWCVLWDQVINTCAFTSCEPSTIHKRIHYKTDDRNVTRRKLWVDSCSDDKNVMHKSIVSINNSPR